MSKNRVIVIGSGFGGMTTALLLQANGYQVTVLEALDVLGGRGRPYKYEGYDFEGGPTVITAPSLLEEIYEKAGLDFKKEVTLLETTPFYELYFPDGTSMKYFGEKDKLLAEIKRISPEDAENYEAFYERSQKIFDVGFGKFVKRPFLSLMDFFKQLPNLIKLRADQSVYKMVSSYFEDDRIRRTFSFHTLLIGGNPSTTTSIYALIHALERQEGVFYVQGGTHALIDNMAKNFEALGGTIMKTVNVAEINTLKQHIFGVTLTDGKFIDTDIVVSNADITRTYTKLLSDDIKKDYTSKWFSRKKYTPGLFVTYFVTNKEYPDISHHSIVFCDRYQGLLKDIFEPNNILTEDFSLYLHAAKRSDSTRAPKGKEMLYVLSVVPNLKSGTDWDSIKEEYQNIILNELDDRVLPGLMDNLDFAVSFTPKDFEVVLQSEWGAFASLQPTLFQSGPFRPHNRSKQIKGLYFVGAGTQPGAGIPGVISTGIIAYDLIKDEFGGR